MPLPVYADCEGINVRSFDYGMNNSWRGQRGVVSAELGPVCAEHALCYETTGARRRTCDKTLYEDLLETCKKKFRAQPNRLKGCTLHVEKGMEQVQQKGPLAFTKAQARARRAQSSAAQSARSSARKQSSAARRAARRRAAYKQIYDQMLGTGNDGTGAGTGTN
ncbi:MAG: hypothetical protein AAF458_20540 [Pseudomonadota bacterium]